ncbi:MAG: anti-sigma factor [Chloroflexales bacterium]|nr:anti-sigma factor [Chloroflexales bacterium]
MRKLSDNNLDHCRAALAQLNNYIDGELAAELCRDLDQHLANCPDCRIVFDPLTKTIKLYHAFREVLVELPPDVEARLLQQLVMRD